MRQIVMLERTKHDVRHDRTTLTNHGERPLQWVYRVDFVVPVRTYEEQVLRFGLDQDVFQELERRGIEPLQIVEKQRQRMLGTCEHSDQPAQGRLEASLRFCRRDFRNSRRLSDDELELGH